MFKREIVWLGSMFTIMSALSAAHGAAKQTVQQAPVVSLLYSLILLIAAYNHISWVNMAGGRKQN